MSCARLRGLDSILALTTEKNRSARFRSPSRIEGMTKTNLSFHLLVLIPLLAGATGCRQADAASGACAGPVDVRSQEDVAAVSACRAIDGDLRITGSAVSDLRGLENLASVRYLVVAGTSLRDLSGLAGLRDVSGITVAANPRLETLLGLEGIHRLDGLVVAGNDSLVSLAGLDSLERADELTISANPRLASLAALASLSHVVELDVSTEGAAFTASDVDSLQRRASRPVALGR